VYGDDAVIERLEEGRRVHAPPQVLVIGILDGVHRGHQAIVGVARAEASARNLEAAVLTFDPHPSAVVGAGAPPKLTTVRRRGELLARLGVARVYVRTFDAALSTWPPERFARELLSETLHARLVVVGHNFRFGAKRAGDTELLRVLGEHLGYEVKALEVTGDEGGPFSSSRARAAIAKGDMEEAARVLGRPHAVTGEVVRGAELGRTLGFPTANLAGIEEMIPANGVYAVAVDEVDPKGRARALALGVMNIGVRPTVGGELARTVEAHLFDLARDLYGATLRVHFVARLRDEKKFSGLDALKAQIAADAEVARGRLASIEKLGVAYG
jgi:riboflavin kinase / FMN adenylyltransferase